VLAARLAGERQSPVQVLLPGSLSAAYTATVGDDL
jgi:hypothetical protein